MLQSFMRQGFPPQQNPQFLQTQQPNLIQPSFQKDETGDSAKEMPTYNGLSHQNQLMQRYHQASMRGMPHMFPPHLVQGLQNHPNFMFSEAQRAMTSAGQMASGLNQFSHPAFLQNQQGAQNHFGQEFGFNRSSQTNPNANLSLGYTESGNSPNGLQKNQSNSTQSSNNHPNNSSVSSTKEPKNGQKPNKTDSEVRSANMQNGMAQAHQQTIQNGNINQNGQFGFAAASIKGAGPQATNMSISQPGIMNYQSNLIPSLLPNSTNQKGGSIPTGFQSNPNHTKNQTSSFQTPREEVGLSLASQQASMTGNQTENSVSFGASTGNSQISNGPNQLHLSSINAQGSSMSRNSSSIQSVKPQETQMSNTEDDENALLLDSYLKEFQNRIITMMVNHNKTLMRIKEKNQMLSEAVIVLLREFKNIKYFNFKLSLTPSNSSGLSVDFLFCLWIE